MDELAIKIRSYVEHRGAVSETEILREFTENESSEEAKRINRIVALFIHSGEMVCSSHEPVSLLSLSDRCLH